VLAGLPAAFQEGSEVATPPAAEPPTPVVVGPLDTLFEGALVGAVDGEGFSETPGYRKLVESISHHSEAELIEKARTELDHAGSLAAPDKWRGAIVHLRGLVAGIETVLLLSGPIGAESDVYRTFITEADGSEGVVVDLVEHPPEVELQYDVVDVEGVFFRTVQYENRKGEMVTAPYLIARNLRVLDLDKVPGRTVMDPLGQILIGAALLFVVVRVLMSMQRSRSRSRGAVRLRPPPPPPTRPS
jgi:hypothetical protein